MIYELSLFIQLLCVSLPAEHSVALGERQRTVQREVDSAGKTAIRQVLYTTTEVLSTREAERQLRPPENTLNTLKTTRHATLLSFTRLHGQEVRDSCKILEEACMRAASGGINYSLRS